jgi:hypothetical protein
MALGAEGTNILMDLYKTRKTKESGQAIFLRNEKF